MASLRRADARHSVRRTFQANGKRLAMADWKWSRRQTGRCRRRPRAFSKAGRANRRPAPSPNIRLSLRRRSFGTAAAAVGVGPADDRSRSSRTECAAPVPYPPLSNERFSKEYQVFHRAILVASAMFFAAAMSPAALAGCGGCGFEAGPAPRMPTGLRRASSGLRTAARHPGARSTARGGCPGADRRRSLGYRRLRDAGRLFGCGALAARLAVAAAVLAVRRLRSALMASVAAIAAVRRLTSRRRFTWSIRDRNIPVRA